MEKFEFVMETIGNIQIPMISIDGDLYITQGNLSKLLGVHPDTLRSHYRRFPKEFDSVRVQALHANEFIKQNKHLLGIKRVRKDMHLWTEDDMITFSMLVRGESGRKIRKEIKRIIKENARRQTISLEEYEALAADMAAIKEEVRLLREERELMKPFLEEVAKLSGKSLHAQRGTKSIRQGGLPN